MKSWVRHFLYFPHNFGYGSIPTMIRPSKDHKLETLYMMAWFVPKKCKGFREKFEKNEGSQIDPPCYFQV